jgi:hypothetical protein
MGASGLSLIEGDVGQLVLVSDGEKQFGDPGFSLGDRGGAKEVEKDKLSEPDVPVVCITHKSIR